MTRLITNNFWWKVFAVALAFGLWLSFVRESQIATSIPVPVQLRNVPVDLEISSDLPDSLYLSLRGPSSRLTASALSGAAVLLDLGSIHKPGEQTFTLGPGNVSLPAGVTLTRIVPSQIRLVFEERITQEVPVEVRFAGPPPVGYRIAKTEVTPPRLKITGPENRVQQVRSVETDPIDLQSTVGNTDFRTTAYVTDPQLRFEGSPVVTVHVILEKIPAKGN
ncbi:MAG: CdaR family protein [Bryobacteraceae bacterium]